MHDEPLVPDDRPLRAKGDGLQPTRAEAKVGLAIATLLLVLYAMWAWAPWQDRDGGDLGCPDQMVCPTP